jgi:hypothetical protein
MTQWQQFWLLLLAGSARSTSSAPAAFTLVQPAHLLSLYLFDGSANDTSPLGVRCVSRNTTYLDCWRRDVANTRVLPAYDLYASMLRCSNMSSAISYACSLQGEIPMQCVSNLLINGPLHLATYSEARATTVHGATATRDAIAGLAYHFDAGDYVDAPAVPIDSDAHPQLTIGGWIKVSESITTICKALQVLAMHLSYAVVTHRAGICYVCTIQFLLVCTIST